MQDTSQKPAMIRAFLAVDIGKEIRRSIEPVLAELKRTHAHVRWLPPANIHLTLAFLGDIRSDTVPVIGEAVREVAAGSPVFAVDVAGLGTFGRKRAPRVVWAGVEPACSLMALQAGLVTVLRGLGLNLDDKPFHPHLTLGRVRSQRGRDSLLSAVRNHGDEPLGRLKVHHVLLMRSVLASAGATYSVLDQAPLGSAP